MCGAKMYIADLLSRAYPAKVGEDEKEFELVNIKVLSVSDQKLKEIQRETETDQTPQVVKSLILKGWPNEKNDSFFQAAPYYGLRDEPTVQDGVIIRRQRVVIAASLRKEMKNTWEQSRA